MKGKLTNKQKAFVREYVIDSNATQAAIRAGYSKKTAANIGNQLLQKTTIKEAINNKNKEVADKCLVTVEYIIEGLKEVITKCLQQEPVMKWDYEQKKLVETGEWKFDSHGANKAFELLGRYKQMFKDGSGQPTSITVNVTDYSKAKVEEEKPENNNRINFDKDITNCDNLLTK
jgi:phage terminase small subunit